MDKAIIKKYNYWQWRTLIILMVGYAFFYFVRKNFSIAMPALKSELGLDETQLGIFLTLNGIIYASFTYLTRTPVAAPPAEVLRLAGLMMPSAALEVWGFFLLKRAMDRGNQGIAWSIAQSAMVIAFLGSILFLRNPSSYPQWTGMALMLASLALFGKERDAT